MAFNLFGMDQSQVPQYTAPQPYQPLFGGQTQGIINQQLSGQLSPAQIQMFNQQFAQNLAKTRGGSFGMPIGAEQSLEGNLASQNALQQQLFGQQLQQTGLQNAGQMNQLGLQQQQMTDQNELEAYKSRAGAFQYANDPASQGLFGQLIGAGVNYGLSTFAPLKNFEWGG